MKKRYIVCLNDSTKEQEEAFLKYIEKENFKWWHRFSNIWLLVDVTGESDVKSLRSAVNKAFDFEHNLVFELKKGNWAGYGPIKGEKDIFSWLKDNWTNKPK